MQDTRRTKDVKALEAALASARALVATLEAALADTGNDAVDLLDAKATLKTYGIGRDGLLAAAERGEIELRRGPRNRILVERDEIERWLRSRPHRPRPKRSADVVDLAAWEAETEREIAAVGASR